MKIEINNPVVILKTIVHDYSDFLKIKFDSYIIPQNEIDINFRLLDYNVVLRLMKQCGELSNLT